MPGTRLFFLICAALAVTLLGLSLFTSSPPDPVMTPDAIAGFAVWNANDCESCHTLYGQGGAYAPDLTTIYGQRGDSYLYEFLLNPATLHPGLRVMPSLSLTRTESAQLIALLAWASERSSEAGFPVNPINVRGGVVSIVGLLPEAPSDTEGGSAVDNGRIWFTRAPGNCSTCHSIEPDVTIVGPSLFGIGDRAGSRLLTQQSPL